MNRKRTAGLRYAPTPGYFLSALRAEPQMSKPRPSPPSEGGEGAVSSICWTITTSGYTMRSMNTANVRKRTDLMLGWLTTAAILCQTVCCVVAQAPAPAQPVPVDPQRSQGQTEAVKELNPDGSLHRIRGKVRVLDAHTIAFSDGTEVDLNGVMDAPELEQKAMLEDSLYPCGRVAAEFLRTLIGDQTVTFLSFGGKERRPRGNCYAGETYLQEAMVRHGWAASDHSGTELAQLIAQEKKRGLWRGKFVPPKRWRKGERLPGEDHTRTPERAEAALREAGGQFKFEDGFVVGVTLGGEKVSDAVLEPLQELSRLRWLKLADVPDRITDAGLAHLAGLTNLEALELSQLSAVTDAGLVHLKGMSKLVELHLSDTKITDAGLAHLKGLANLTRLGLSGTQVSDAGLPHLMALTKLRHVSLLRARVTDEGVKKLKEARPQLEVNYR